MRNSSYLIVSIFIIGLCISCTPQSISADKMENRPEMFGTGGDQSIYPDNDRDWIIMIDCKTNACSNWTCNLPYLADSRKGIKSSCGRLAYDCDCFHI